MAASSPKSDQLLVYVHSDFLQQFCAGDSLAMPLDGAEQRVIWSGERALGAVTESSVLQLKHQAGFWAPWWLVGICGMK